jgi:hypothetical protein
VQQTAETRARGRRSLRGAGVVLITGALLATAQFAAADSATSTRTALTGSVGTARVGAESLSLATSGANGFRAAYSQKSCKKKKKDTLYLSRFSMCARSSWRFEQTLNGRVTGKLSGSYILTGTATSSGARTVAITVGLSGLTATGTLRNATITASLPCKGKGCSTPRPHSGSVASWRQHPTAKLVFTAPAPKTTSKIASAAFSLRLRVSNSRGGASAAQKITTYRCDAAKYLHYKDGCVFSGIKQVLVYSRAHDGAMASLITAAQSDPASTVPQFSGKTVPGAPSSKHPLHRVLSSKQNKANHKAAVGACVDGFGENYTDGGNVCDEYPFRSTKEGAAKGDGRFTVQAIPAGDSSYAASGLKGLYKLARILDGEAFYVSVVD